MFDVLHRFVKRIKVHRPKEEKEKAPLPLKKLSLAYSPIERIRADNLIQDIYQEVRSSRKLPWLDQMDQQGFSEREVFDRLDHPYQEMIHFVGDNCHLTLSFDLEKDYYRYWQYTPGGLLLDTGIIAFSHQGLKHIIDAQLHQPHVAEDRL